MKRIIEENLVIRPKRSRKRKILSNLFAFVLVTVSIIFALYAGFLYGVGQKDRDAVTIENLRSDISNIGEKYDSLLVEEAKLVQSENVQKSAYVELEKNYEIVEQRNEFLNRRVNFYRSILSPEDGISGVRIHDVSLRAEQEELYFEVVLIQAINHENEAMAKIYVELFETKDDRKPVLSWKAKSHDFNFKFSETVSGSIPKTSETSANLLKITVLPNGDSSKRLVEWYKV